MKNYLSNFLNNSTLALFIPIISLHSYSYRPREEIKEVRETRDPITMFKRRITDCNLVTPEELKVKGQRILSLIMRLILLALGYPKLLITTVLSKFSF